MCQALEDMRNKVVEENTRSLNIKYIQKVMQQLAYTVEQAMGFLNIPAEHRHEYAAIVNHLY